MFNGYLSNGAQACLRKYNYMEQNLNYIGYLIGRIFLIADKHDLTGWNGNKEIAHEESDYEKIGAFVVYEDAGFSEFKRENGQTYLLFFSMSTKVEIFRTENGVVICEGFYLNKSFEMDDEIRIVYEEFLPQNIRLTGNSFVISDAAIDSDLMSLSLKEGIHKLKNDIVNSYAIITRRNAWYSTRKVTIKVKGNSEEIELKGIAIEPRSSGSSKG